MPQRTLLTFWTKWANGDHSLLPTIIYLMPTLKTFYFKDVSLPFPYTRWMFTYVHSLHMLFISPNYEKSRPENFWTCIDYCVTQILFHIRQISPFPSPELALLSLVSNIYFYLSIKFFYILLFLQPKIVTACYMSIISYIYIFLF